MQVEIDNFTHLPNLRYASEDNEGRKFGVLIVKATFDVKDDGLCVLSEDQEPFIFTDEYRGELNVSSVRYPSDLVPYKPSTDILIDAIARAPGGNAQSSWTLAVNLEDQAGVAVTKQLRVHGPRQWEPKWRRRLTEAEQRSWADHTKLFLEWELTEAEPIVELPIHYEYAYGGSVPRIKPGSEIPSLEAYQHNPVGRGWIDRERSDHTKSIAAPQIEAADRPVEDPYCHYEPQGFGPIPPAWLPRRPLGGTYDQTWIDTVWPKWASDYNFAFHNSAPADLRTPEGEFVDGDIRFSLTNHGGDRSSSKIEFTIKNSTVLVSVQYDADPVEFFRLNIDTLYFDIKHPDPKRWRVYVLGRGAFSLKRNVRLGIYRKEDWIQLDGSTLKDAFPAFPHPSQCI